MYSIKFITGATTVVVSLLLTRTSKLFVSLDDIGIVCPDSSI